MSIPKLMGLKGAQKPLDNKKELIQIGETKEKEEELKPLGGKPFGSKPGLPKFKSKISSEEKSNEEKKEVVEKTPSKTFGKIGQLKKEVQQIQEKSKKESEEAQDELEEDSNSIEKAEESSIPEQEKEEVVEKKEEVKSKRGRKSKLGQSSDNNTARVETNANEMTDFNDAANVIFSSFADPNWDKHEEEIANKLSEIIINSDMNSATLKSALGDIDHLRSEIWLEHDEYKNMYINLSCEKPEGLIERVKKLNMQGDNESARKSNAIHACENYVRDGAKINLFELLEATRKRYFFLKSVMDSLDFKANCLITMSETLKNETRTLNI